MGGLGSVLTLDVDFDLGLGVGLRGSDRLVNSSTFVLVCMCDYHLLFCVPAGV